MVLFYQIMRYYIFNKLNNEAGDGIRNQLAATPNGTAFVCPWIFINSNKDVWITYPNSDNQEYIASSIKYIERSGGIKIYPTDITEEILIPEGCTRNNNDPITKKFNDELTELFKPFAPELNFY